MDQAPITRSRYIPDPATYPIDLFIDVPYTPYIRLPRYY